LLLLPVLLGALMVHAPNGWVFNAPNGGWEYPAFLALTALRPQPDRRRRAGREARPPELERRGRLGLSEPKASILSPSSRPQP
jgi:hypothetical protein